MNFEQCYIYIRDMYMKHDVSNIGRDYSALLYLSGNESGYIYASYINGQKFIEPVRHKSANIFLSMSIATFEQLINGHLDLIRAFTTGQIQAKGNVMLALSIYNSFKK